MKKIKLRQLESYIGKNELQEDYNIIQTEGARLYRRPGQKPGVVKRFLIYTTLAAALFGGSMAVGLVKTEDVKDTYNSVRSFITGQENPDTLDTIDNKLGGN